MKESEFIELLNLYLDHEISATDAARLEAEVQGNPARRKTYQHYCRMQKACKVLAADFRSDAEVAAVPRGAKVADFDSAAKNVARSGKRGFGFYTVGSLAALAASIAVVLVLRGRHEPPASASVFQAASITDAGSAVVASTPPSSRGGIVSATSAPKPNQRSQSSMVADPLLLTGQSHASALLASATQQAGDNLAWIHNVQFAPLQQRIPAEDLRFGASPATMRPEGRSLGGSRGTVEENVEMTAFRFVK